MNRAARLVAYFKSHARKVYATMEADDSVRKARRLLRWVTRGSRTEFKRWEAFKDIQSEKFFSRIEELDDPLDRLVKHRYLRLRPAAAKPLGGRPADPVYEINPLWDRRVNRVNRVTPPSELAEGDPERSLHGLHGLLGGVQEEEDDLESPFE